MSKSDGLRSFYAGLKMALIATMASYGSYFFAYRFLKNLFTKLFKLKELRKRDITIITTLAGNLSVLFANPLWFINTRVTLD